MNFFNLNARGGWIVPSGTELLTVSISAPRYSVFGDRCKFGDNAEFGGASKFGNGCRFGSGAKFGDDTTFADCAEFGCSNRFGDRTRFGYAAKFGNKTIFGKQILFGACTKFGDDCYIEDEKLVKIITAANIDGTGRQVMLIFNGETVKVRAGCFFGTYQEMARNALSESKPVYASVVTAMAEAMINELKK